MLRDGVQRLTCRRCGTLLLSSAASLCVIADARAADLPVKAKAVEYMRVCSLYGAGFWYIPGTDSWMQVSDYLRVDTTFDAAGSHGQPAWNGGSGEHDRYFDKLRLSLSPAVAHLHAGQHPVRRGPVAPGGLSGSFLNGVGGGYVANNILSAGAAPTNLSEISGHPTLNGAAQ